MYFISHHYKQTNNIHCIYSLFFFLPYLNPPIISISTVTLMSLFASPVFLACCKVSSIVICHAPVMDIEIIIVILSSSFFLFFICERLLIFCNSLLRLFPEKVSGILSDSLKRERVLSLCDASDVLRDAFSQTEACMNHYYEV